jgi:hypothetical protein
MRRLHEARRRPAVLLGLCAAGLVLAAGCKESPPELRFGDDEDHFDFARLEHELPLTTEERYSITPSNLKLLSQEQVDRIYARLSAGPMPDGAFDGDLFFARGVDGHTRLAEILGGGYAGAVADFKITRLEFLGGLLWKGKVFYKDERVLRNRIQDLKSLELSNLVDAEGDELRIIEVNGHDAWELFPARLYCGQSLLDGRRESVIIDYFFSNELPGYHEKPDRLGGRHGFAIRDEIRMVRPGFYLGRAYLDRVFGLNFTLYNEAIAKAGDESFRRTGAAPEDCWVGMQRAVAQAD